MKTKITFKQFFSTIGRGIWQAICWVGALLAAILGIKDATKAAKVIKWVIAVGVAAVVVFWAIDYGSDVYRYRIKDHVWERYTGPRYSYWQSDHNRGYMVDIKSGEKVLKNLSWVTIPENGDSMAVFATTPTRLKPSKRGYFNRFTGEILEAKYDKAWIFGDCGLASVLVGDTLMFIDRKGNKAFEKTFYRPGNSDGYVYHGNYCVVEDPETGKFGMIDTKGEWAIEPRCKSIDLWIEKYWIVTDDRSNCGVYALDMSEILPTEYTNINIDNDGSGIYATRDGVRKRFDYKGNVIDEFVVYNVWQLTYISGYDNDTDDELRSVAKCRGYSIGYGQRGLMSADGKPLTPAIYCNIIALSDDLYQCDLDDDGILLDSKGNKVNK